MPLSVPVRALRPSRCGCVFMVKPATDPPSQGLVLEPEMLKAGQGCLPWARISPLRALARIEGQACHPNLLDICK